MADDNLATGDDLPLWCVIRGEALDAFESDEELQGAPWFDQVIDTAIKIINHVKANAGDTAPITKGDTGTQGARDA